MINTRSQEIIRLILEKKDYITINEIANQLNVSNKTVRNDLDKISEWLHENNLELIKKSGVGICINGDEAIKKLVLEQIISHKKIDKSQKNRKIYIGMKLILNEKGHVYEFADDLQVSRATIYKDITELKMLFKQYKIQLFRKNNTAVTIEGNEKYYRDFLFDYLIEDSNYKLFSEIVINQQYQCKGVSPFPVFDIKDDEIIEFVQVLKSIHPTYLQSIQNDAFVQLVLRMLILYIRVQNGHEIKLSERFLNEIEDLPYLNIAKELCDAVSKYYKINFSEMEFNYLQIYMVCLQNSDSKQQIQNEDDLLYEITHTLIDEWENELKYPFSQDKELYQGLFEHFLSAVPRIQHGIVIENLLMDDIQMFYKNTFQTVKQSIHVIENKLKCKVNDAEIGFITLYLATALDRLKRPLNTILISDSRMGANNLLISKLTTQFRELNITKIINSLSFNNLDLKDADLILTTNHSTYNTDIPVIVINPVLYDYDILRLKSVVKTYYAKKNDPILHK